MTSFWGGLGEAGDVMRYEAGESYLEDLEGGKPTTFITWGFFNSTSQALY